MSSAAIVVEGGAMRGIFAAGVLDVFLERGFEPFDLAIGSSAGACNLSSYLARQHGRNRRCYLTQMRRAEFADARRFLRGGHWLDIDYLWGAFDREDPLDIRTAAASRARLVVATTCVETGEPAYFEPGVEDMWDVLRASSAVPVLFRRFVELEGRRLSDGGLAAPIPVEEAYRRGARRILVIRSRPDGHPGPSRLENMFAAAMLRDHPALVAAFRRYREVYARSVAFIRSPPPDCSVVHVAPEVMHTRRMTRDERALDADYDHGRAVAAGAIGAWEAIADATSSERRASDGTAVARSGRLRLTR